MHIKIIIYKYILKFINLITLQNINIYNNYIKLILYLPTTLKSSFSNI